MSKQIQRFWASRNESAWDEVALWVGERPIGKRSYYHNARLQVVRIIQFTSKGDDRTTMLGEIDAQSFRDIHGFTVRKGRCVEITDPRVHKIEVS